MGEHMDSDKLLRLALVVFGAIFLLVYPLAIVWPSGWAWHQGAPMANDYYMMIVAIYATLGVFLILAARDPAANASRRIASICSCNWLTAVLAICCRPSLQAPAPLVFSG